MSIWTLISETVAALVARGEALLALFDRDVPPERSVAFTIAVVSLGAKMAKADGQVRPVEVAAYFLALLELARWGLIQVSQEDWLHEIVVRRTETSDSAFVSEWAE